MNLSKIDPHLHQFVGTHAAAAAAEIPETVGVIVRHRGEMFFSQAEGDTHTFKLLNATAMRVRPDAIEALSDRDEIEFIWADLPVHTCLDVSVPKIGVPAVWDAGFTGAGIKLAIVDTGIDPTHPDFSGRIVARKNFAGGSKNDENGHGTHVASIAAGTGSKSGGKYRGVAPGAELYIAKVLDASGSGSMSGVMSGVEWAVEQGAQVVNLSLGSVGPCDGTDALSTLCDTAVRDHGVVLCVAAGNEGPGASTVGSPGCARLVITVGASSDTDAIASFSSRGPTGDGRVKPDIVFPGVGIVAAQAAGTQLGTVVEPGYISLSGTSMATPHASGSACLLLQANGSLTPAQIKSALRNTAVDLNQPANEQGAGRANVFAALQEISGGTPPPTPEPTPSPPPPTPEPTPPPAPTPTPPPDNGNSGCLPQSLVKFFGKK
ncbi:MAG TPA: alkaline serine protease [Anaerolineae bacterium]|nr:alkaline serine protease [Anaerolineae bacterium]